jgi:hypothetical protein
MTRPGKGYRQNSRKEDDQERQRLSPAIPQIRIPSHEIMK